MECLKLKCVSLKCVCIGDDDVGKTSMLMTYSLDEFPGDYVPTVFDNYQRLSVVNFRQVRLHLWDTAGREEYNSLRPLAYPHTDVFIVCYSVNSPSSFKNVKAKWLPEIRSHCPSTPVVMVGTKADTRNLSKECKQGMPFVDLADAKELGEELGVDRVMECSAKTKVGLSEVFHEVMKIGIAAQSKSKIKKKRNKCVLL